MIVELYSLAQTDFVLSSSLSEVYFKTDQEAVEVVVSCSSGDIYRETLYPYEGHVTIYNLRELVEGAYRNTGISFDQINIAPAGMSAINVGVLYCECSFAADLGYRAVQEMFLTTLSSRRVPPHFTILLSWMAMPDEEQKIQVAYDVRTSESTTVTHKTFAIRRSGVTTAQLQSLEITEKRLLEQAYGSSMPSEAQVISAIITLGGRCASFYVSEELRHAERFLFRNCFGVKEWACLPAKNTHHVDADLSQANLGTYVTLYDRTVKETEEVETGPLTAGESRWIRELLTSYEVWYPVKASVNEAENLLPVLITDFTCEVSTDHDPNTVKFTWRYTNNTPLLVPNVSSGIFTSEFNPVYS